VNPPQNTSTWWKHDANLATDLRFTKLQSLLGIDPYGLICRRYDFAATMRQDGDLSCVDDGVLALRLEFKGKGSRLRRLLMEAGYLDSEGQIVGWLTDRFRLYNAVREQNRERGLKSAKVRAEAKEKAQGASSRSDKEEMTVEEKTATAQRAVARPVEAVALSAPSSAWPDELSPDQLAALCEDTGKTLAVVATHWVRYRDRKIRYGDDFGGGAGLAGFRDYLREAKDEKPTVAKVEVTAPPHWREVLELLFEENAINKTGASWGTLPHEIQQKVIGAANSLGP